MKVGKSRQSVAFCLAQLLLVTACSKGANDQEMSTNSVDTTTTTLAPAALALSYFEELAKNSRVGFEAAKKLANRTAFEYADYQNEYLEAVVYATADGQNFENQALQTARIDDFGRILIESTESRITYSDFVFANGKLSNFKVEGRDLSGNLRPGVLVFVCYTSDGQCESDSSADLKILHSYVSAAGDLVVTYSFRIGSKHSSVREDRTGDGLPNHEVVDSTGTKIKATAGIETFARGETRTNVVVFGPLRGGGRYEAKFRFRSDGQLLEFDDVVLGTYTG